MSATTESKDEEDTTASTATATVHDMLRRDGSDALFHDLNKYEDMVTVGSIIISCFLSWSNVSSIPSRIIIVDLNDEVCGARILKEMGSIAVAAVILSI